MRAVVQRVREASVTTGDAEVGRVACGLAVLVGVGQDDTEEDVKYLSRKIAGLRIFEDAEGKMNLSVLDTGGSILLISQFTLYGDCRKGRRPSFTSAADPDRAETLYEKLADALRTRGLEVETGEFKAEMKVHIFNDGPVTLLLDSKKIF